MTDYLNKKVNFQYSKISVKITKKIYFGSSSKIYLCTDVNYPSISYCLKISTARNDDKLACNSISSELVTLLALKDKSNIVKILDYYPQEINNCVTYFILMEYCGNGSLAETMVTLSNEKNSFSEPQIWKIMYHISQGLKSIHANKTAHRDLKPENILTTMDGVYKISDFGSVTNKFYDNINNNRNEIIFDISRNTTPAYRAPEQLDLYTGYPINEKVDIWALGIILYNLLFDSQPFTSVTNLKGESSINLNSSKIHQIVNGSIVLTEEMVSPYNPYLIQMLQNMMKPNPSERISASDIVFFIEQNKESLLGGKNENKFLNIKKRTYSLAKTVSDATAKIFKRHSTQFWVIKLLSDDITYPPKMKYVKLLVNKAWAKRDKVSKLFQNISTRPVHYLSFLALKSLYVIHSYVFLGPSETLSPANFNLDEFLAFLTSLWSTRYSTGNYDKDEILKNSYVTKFIISYSEFLKTKIAYHKKYPHVENNFSIENLVNRNNFDFSLLVDKKFITDTISLYSLVYQKFIQIPVIVPSISSTLDSIIQIFNEELISLFNFIFYILISYKNSNSHKIINGNNDSILKIYDSQFLEITAKAKEYVEKYRKFRSSIKSKNVMINFPGGVGQNVNSNIYVEYLKSLDNHLKFFPNNDFNLKSFFALTKDKDIIGIKMNKSVEQLIALNLFFQVRRINMSDGQNSSNNTSKNLSKNQIDYIRENSSEEVDEYSPSNKRVSSEFDNIKVNKNDSGTQINKFAYPVNQNNNVINQRSISNSKKGFDFSEEKFQNSQNKFDFEMNKNKVERRDSTPDLRSSNNNIQNQLSAYHFNQSINNSMTNSEKILNTPIKVQINATTGTTSDNNNNNGERGRSIDRKNSNPIHYAPQTNNSSNTNNIQVNSGNNLTPQRQLNNNQSLFNHNFFSKSNNEDNLNTNQNPNVNPNVILNNSSNNTPNNNFTSFSNDQNPNSNVMNVLNEIFDSNKGVCGFDFSNLFVNRNNNLNNNGNNNLTSNVNVNLNNNPNRNIFLQSNFGNSGQVQVTNTPNNGIGIMNMNNLQRQNSLNPSIIKNDAVLLPYQKIGIEGDNRIVINPNVNVNANNINMNNVTSNTNYMMNNNNSNNNMNYTNKNTNFTNYGNNNSQNNMNTQNTRPNFNNNNNVINQMNPMNPVNQNLYFNNEYYESIYSMKNNPFMISNMNNNNTSYINNNTSNFNDTQYRLNDQYNKNINPINIDTDTTRKSSLTENNNQNNIPNFNLNAPADNKTDNKIDPFNLLNKNPNEQEDPNKNENNTDDYDFESVKSQFPQMSIINIQNNYNDIKVFKEANIETLANQFLKEEFSKKNLQWLISSKDIVYGKQIGFGGSSEVFRADYRGTEVAIKKLRILEVKEENLKEFKREVSSLIMLRHPNLVLFMGSIAEKDNICIVTEYCAGGTLFNILHQKKDLIITWELRLRILYDIAVGMNFLHTNSPPIIHRDLKSLNILLTEQIERPSDNTRIKISDFGLSKIIKTFDSVGKEQMTGQLGTCHWMAPEVIENKQYTLKADVFSYGIIIWEILARRTPYNEMSQQQISFYVTVKKGRPDKNLIPQNTPPALIKLMEMCWDSEQNNRPSFEQIIQYIKKIKL